MLTKPRKQWRPFDPRNARFCKLARSRLPSTGRPIGEGQSLAEHRRCRHRPRSARRAPPPKARVAADRPPCRYGSADRCGNHRHHLLFLHQQSPRCAGAFPRSSAGARRADRHPAAELSDAGRPGPGLDSLGAAGRRFRRGAPVAGGTAFDGSAEKRSAARDHQLRQSERRFPDAATRGIRRHRHQDDREHRERPSRHLDPPRSRGPDRWRRGRSGGHLRSAQPSLVPGGAARRWRPLDRCVRLLHRPQAGGDRLAADGCPARRAGRRRRRRHPSRCAERVPCRA